MKIRNPVWSYDMGFIIRWANKCFCHPQGKVQWSCIIVFTINITCSMCGNVMIGVMDHSIFQGFWEVRSTEWWSGVWSGGLVHIWLSIPYHTDYISQIHIFTSWFRSPMTKDCCWVGKYKKDPVCEIPRGPFIRPRLYLSIKIYHQVQTDLMHFSKRGAVWAASSLKNRSDRFYMYPLNLDWLSVFCCPQPRVGFVTFSSQCLFSCILSPDSPSIPLCGTVSWITSSRPRTICKSSTWVCHGSPTGNHMRFFIIPCDVHFSANSTNKWRSQIEK